MRTNLQAFVVVALVAGTIDGAVSAEAPALQYRFEQGKHYGYDITIKVETDDYTENYAGYLLFRGMSAQGGRMTLECQGLLDPDIQWKRNAGLTAYGPENIIVMPGHLLIDSSGKLLGVMTRISPLPYVLGFMETLPLEKIPAEPLNQWQWEDEFELMESHFAGLSYIPMLPSRKAKEEIDYSIAAVEGDLVRIDKKYLMRSGEAIAQTNDAASRVRLDGSGSVVFDRRAGMVSSIDAAYTLLSKNKDGSRTVTAKVDCRLMNPNRLDQILTELDNKRKRNTGEAYAEIPKKPLDKSERAKLLRDLRSPNAKVVEAAVVRLISAPADERPADFSVPLAKIVQEGQYFLRLKAAQALIVWATPEAEAALAAATDDHTIVMDGRPGRGYPLAEAAYEALATIGTESAARAIAKQILDPSQTPKEVLKRMGPAAEAAMIDLVLNVSGGNAEPRAACEVLAEVGGPRSVPVLQQAAQGWAAQSHAKAALEAIARREGMSVEELLEKAPSAAPASAAEPKTASSSSMFRTWTDSTGTFTIEAEMVRTADGVVTLKKRNGNTVDVPIDRLSQADRDFIGGESAQAGFSSSPQPGPKPIPRPGPSQVSQPSPRATRATVDTEIVGGSGGFEFRSVGRGQEPLLGIHYHTIPWRGERAVGLHRALFDRSMPSIPGVVLAKPGYAVGGMNVDAQDLVNAMEIIFMRLKPDGSLDAADSYKSPWIGTPTGRPTKTLGGTGATVIGIRGRRAAALDAIGLVMQ